MQERLERDKNVADSVSCLAHAADLEGHKRWNGGSSGCACGTVPCELRGWTGLNRFEHVAKFWGRICVPSACLWRISISCHSPCPSVPRSAAIVAHVFSFCDMSKKNQQCLPCDTVCGAQPPAARRKVWQDKGTKGRHQERGGNSFSAHHPDKKSKTANSDFEEVSGKIQYGAKHHDTNSSRDFAWCDGHDGDHENH